MERISEVLFGLIMVLTVTCSFSVAEADPKNVHAMLLAALGCNLAWGVIDAVFYLMARFSEQGQGILALQALRQAADSSEAHAIIADALPPLLASVLTPTEFDLMRERLNQLPEPLSRPRLSKEDWLAGLGVFLWVFLSTFPVVIPFVLVNDSKSALRISNGVAILLLFFTGYAFGRCAGGRPWLTGIAVVALGSSLVGIAIALGG
jgi:VIT1/CCC1 family predicted Fe2+/Mn2+ transporter